MTAASNIVITGAGLCTPLGNGREATWAAVRDDKIGLGPYTAIEDPAQAPRGGGECPADDRVDADAPRAAAYLRLALHEALAHAGLDPAGRGWPVPPRRVGLMLGTTLHGMTAGGKMVRAGHAEPLRDFLAPAVLARAAGHLPIAGFAATTCSACSSGLGSMLLARTLLDAGELDLVIAGGYDPISEYAYAGFNSLRLVDERPPRPFARDRAGMKVSEGYAVVVMERADHAAERGAGVFAQLAGGGESADAHHLTQPEPGGAGAARAIDAALTNANATPRDIDLVVAHATGTPDNDAAEVAALQTVFGDRLAEVPAAGLKSRLGHTLGAAGAAELILAGLALRDGVLPTTAQTTAADHDFAPFCLADGPPRPATLRAAVNTSLGFGGANTCVVTRAADALAPTSPSTAAAPPAPCDVWITGIGVITPDAAGRAAFADHLASGRAATPGPVPDDTVLTHLPNARRARRMSDYVKLTLAAAKLALDDAGVRPDDYDAFGQHTAGLLGTAHGSTKYSYAYYRGLVDDGLHTANPMQFAEGVPNAGAAHLSMSLRLRGPCQTIIGSRTAGLDALRLAALRIRTGEWDRAVVCAGEEHDPRVERCLAELGLPMTTAGGAATLVLESPAAARRRGVAPRARVGDGAQIAAASNPRQHRHRLTQLLRGAPPTGLVITPLGGPDRRTWLGRVEAAALRRTRGLKAPSAFSPSVAESFSASGLFAVIHAVHRAGEHGPHTVLTGDAHGLHTAVTVAPA